MFRFARGAAPEFPRVLGGGGDHGAGLQGAGIPRAHGECHVCHDDVMMRCHAGVLVSPDQGAGAGGES